MRRFWLAIGSAGMLAAPLAAVGATSAHATTIPSDTTITSSVKQVTSSSGKSLYLRFIAHHDDRNSSAIVTDVTVILGTKGVVDGGTGETHIWNFPLTSDSWQTPVASPGTIVVDAGNQLGSFGHATMTWTLSGQAQSYCGGDRKVSDGTFTGDLRFDTGTSKWGKVGSTNLTFKEPNQNEALYNDGCPVKTVTPKCHTGISWQDQGWSGAVLDGRSHIAFRRLNSLHAPAGAYRTDSLRDSAPAPTITTGVLAVHTSGGMFTGRGTGSTPFDPSSYVTDCKHSGATITQKHKLWETGNLVLAKNAPLQAHFQITSDYNNPDAIYGLDYERLTYP